MTIQQLEYIVALNKFRHFVKASEYCGVAQPTLSLMIKKLENELEVKIFDRNKHPIAPTEMGSKLIAQAEKTLREINKIGELVEAETDKLSGPLTVGVIPTIASYVVPEFIKQFRKDFKEVELNIVELPTASLIEALKKNSVDMFIAATPLNEADFYEIPVYYEKFAAYFSSDSFKNEETLSADNMPQENLWILKEGHCLRDQTFNFCQKSTTYNQTFEAGSIDTLIKVVDNNGGYSVIPELHIPTLSESQKQNICKIDSPPAVREVSIVIKQDFIKERMINAVADSIKKVIPEEMLDSRLKKYSIKL